MDSSIDQLIRSNNEGVTLMSEEGSERQAVTSLNQALTLVQHIMITSVEALDGSSSSLQIIASMRRARNATDFASQVPLVNLQDSSGHFIYNRAVTLSPSDASRIGPEILETYSACVLLNLALVYHLQGKEGNQVFLHRAEQLYTIIYRLLRQSIYEEDETSIFFLLVSINNLSHIHFEQRRYNEMREMLQWLRMTLQEAGTKANKILSQLDLSRIFLNVLLMARPLLAAAA
jgi:hypothetical protein